MSGIRSAGYNLRNATMNSTNRDNNQSRSSLPPRNFGSSFNLVSSPLARQPPRNSGISFSMQSSNSVPSAQGEQRAQNHSTIKAAVSTSTSAKAGPSTQGTSAGNSYFARVLNSVQPNKTPSASAPGRTTQAVQGSAAFSSAFSGIRIPSHTRHASGITPANPSFSRSAQAPQATVSRPVNPSPLNPNRGSIATSANVSAGISTPAASTFDNNLTANSTPVYGTTWNSAGRAQWGDNTSTTSLTNPFGSSAQPSTPSQQFNRFGSSPSQESVQNAPFVQRWDEDPDVYMTDDYTACVLDTPMKDAPVHRKRKAVSQVISAVTPYAKRECVQKISRNDVKLTKKDVLKVKRVTWPSKRRNPQRINAVIRTTLFPPSQDDDEIRTLSSDERTKIEELESRVNSSDDASLGATKPVHHNILRELRKFLGRIIMHANAGDDVPLTGRGWKCLGHVLTGELEIVNWSGLW